MTKDMNRDSKKPVLSSSRRLTHAERARIYRAKYPEATKERYRAYCLANKERIAEKAKVWRLANAERVSIEKREERLANLDEVRAKDREYYAANREKKRLNKRRATLKNKHAMSLVEWESLFIGQGKSCAICKSTEHGNRDWHVDHFHTTGKVRGALCHNCNLLLGQAKDDIGRLQAAIQYLEKFQ